MSPVTIYVILQPFATRSLLTAGGTERRATYHGPLYIVHMYVEQASGSLSAFSAGLSLRVSIHISQSEVPHCSWLTDFLIFLQAFEKVVTRESEIKVLQRW